MVFIKRRMTTLLMAAIMLFPLFASAFPVLNIDKNGQLTGASNVEVNGSLYDVDFVSGSCVELFFGCGIEERGPFFFDYGHAYAATEALSNQVLIGSYSTPDKVKGCSNLYISCGVNTPWDLLWADGLELSDWSLQAHTAIVPENIVLRSTNPGIYDTLVYADWRVAEVSEPGAAALLLLGGIGFLAARRKYTSNKNDLSA